MNGTEIITYLACNLPALSTTVSAITGSIFTAVFLRFKTGTKEFEKVKAGRFEEVAEELLDSGKMTYTEFYKAKNFLNVARKADQYYFEEAKTEEAVDEYDFDWFMRFYEAVGDISDDKMQELWSKILAGEIAHPQKYSLRTIDALKNFSKHDAEMFEKIIIDGGIIYLDQDHVFLPSYDYYLEEHGIKYSQIMVLEEMGLINSGGFLVVQIPLSEEEENLILSNGDLSLFARPVLKGKEQKLQIQQYPLTGIGKEIASLYKLILSNKSLISLARELKQQKPSEAQISVKRIVGFSNGLPVHEEKNLLDE